MESRHEQKHSDKKVLTVEELTHSVSHFVMRSTYGGRAKAWEAIGSCLWKETELIKPAWELVEKRCNSERLTSVQYNIFNAMTPLFNHDKKRYENVVRVLLDRETASSEAPYPINILGTFSGVRMHRYIDHWLPELSDDLIQEMLTSEDESLRLIGAWWAFCESFRDGRNQHLLDELIQLSDQHRILFADAVAGAFNWTEFRNLAEEKLLELFDDKNSNVLEQVADVFRGIKPNEFENYRSLATKFISSPAFVEKSFSLLYALEETTSDVTELVIIASERLLRSITDRGDQHGRRGTGLHQLQDLLAREYASSERKPVARKRILDLIDFMLENNIYGVDSIISANDR